MLRAMDENETDSTSKPGRKRISRRSFLASGAAFGGVVLWGASGGAASADAPPMQGSPPILNTAPVPPIIIQPTGGTVGVAGPGVQQQTPPDTNTDTNTGGGTTGKTAGKDVGPDGVSGSGSGGGPFFDFIPGFHFRFRNSPFSSPF
jgi:hypothetical protein